MPRAEQHHQPATVDETASFPTAGGRGAPIRIQNPFRIGLLAGLGVLLAIVIGAAVAQLATVLTYVFAAVFLALGIEPAVALLTKRRVPRAAAVAVVFVVLAAVVTGVMLIIVPVIVNQAAGLIESIVSYSQGLSWQEFLKRVQATVGSAIDVNQVVLQVTTYLQQNAAKITGGVLSIGVGIASGFAGAIVVAILTLYFTASMQTFKQASYRLVPLSSRARFAEIAEQIFSSVGRYVIGQVILALCNGVLSFLFLTIIGARLAVVFAFIAFLGSLIPLVGTISAAVLIVLGQLVIHPDAQTWLVVAIYYVVYMQVEAYLLSPRIMNRAVKVPGVVVVIAALTGGTLLGILGALVAIPIAAAILLIIDQVVIPRQNEL